MLVQVPDYWTTSTMLWLTRKQRWTKGPDLLLDIGSFRTFCSTALNSTSIIFTFIGSLDNNYYDDSIIKIVRFDFESKQWTDIPKMGEKLQANSMTCSMTTLFDKQSTPKVMIVFNGNTKKYNNNFEISTYLVSLAISIEN